MIRYAIIALVLSLTCSVSIAKEGTIQCANLIYGGTHTSKCFSDEFLNEVQKRTCIPTERRFKSVKLGSEELFNYPFVIMTGEASFAFTSKERTNLKKYLESGGFLLASAGCSNSEWDRCFRGEMKRVFDGKDVMNKISMDHTLFKTAKAIDEIKLKHGTDDPSLQGIELNGKIVTVYSHHGLNDTSNTEGCCCCGGNEIRNSMEILVNIFVYALLH